MHTFLCWLRKFSFSVEVNRSVSDTRRHSHTWSFCHRQYWNLRIEMTNILSQESHSWSQVDTQWQQLSTRFIPRHWRLKIKIYQMMSWSVKKNLWSQRSVCVRFVVAFRLTSLSVNFSNKKVFAVVKFFFFFFFSPVSFGKKCRGASLWENKL